MFKKSTRKDTKIKIALTGPSGAGKTHSALAIAKGFGGKTALIDTENGSASLYSDEFDFDDMLIAAPYTTQKYVDAINAAVEGGYQNLIIDSITHHWSGAGGLLQQKESLDARGGNSYTNWAKITPKHEAFMSAILNSNINVIATMRSKQDYVLEENAKGKQAPKKVGLAPQQREGAEYEFTTVLDLSINHEATASKDRTKLFPVGEFFTPSEATGKKIMTWLKGGGTPAPEKKESEMENMSESVEDIVAIENEALGFAKQIGAAGNTDLEQKILDSIAAANGDVEKMKVVRDRAKERASGH